MENFDKMAKNYDTEKRADRAKVISEQIRLHISGGQEKSAIEYGCGTGLVGIELIDDFSRVLFVDSSPEMIEQVKQKLIALDKSVDFAICHDFMSDVPLNIRVDYVFSSLVLHHIKDTKIILSRLHSVLNDEGRLLIVDLDAEDGSFHAKYPDFDGFNGFDQSSLAEMAAEAGFREVRIETFYRGSKIVSGEDKPYSLFILDAVR